MKNYSDMSIEILQKTHDGEDLAPHHLGLVQLAVNGNLNEKGDVAFVELYRNVEQGYKKPWLCEVENLTKDHEGYVYWKGIQIEHYSFHDYPSEKLASEELGKHCRQLEERGLKVSSGNLFSTIWA